MRKANYKGQPIAAEVEGCRSSIAAVPTSAIPNVETKQRERDKKKQ